MSSDEFVEYPLQELIDFQEGPGIMARDFRDEGVPLIRLAGLTADSLLEGCNYLDTDMVDKKWKHFRLQEGDTLLSTSASLGRTARVRAEAVDCVAYTGLIRMRPKDRRLLSDYIQYLLQSPHFQRQVQAMGAGSVMRHFGPSHLKQMTVTLPDPVKQQWTVDVLRALDAKLDSNVRVAEAALAVARAVFEQTLSSADAVATLGTLGTIRGGGTPKSSEPTFWEPGSVPWITPKDMTALSGSPVIWRGERNISELGLEKSSAKLLPIGTVLYTSRATLGMVAIAQQELSTNQGFITLEPAEGISSGFVYLTLCAQRNRIAAKANGSTFPEVNKSNFKAVECPMPDQEARQHIDAVAKPAFELIAGLTLENERLRAIRDELLPKLVSGKIRVPAAQEIVEDGGEGALEEATAP